MNTYIKSVTTCEQTWNCSMQNSPAKVAGHKLYLAYLNYCGDLAARKKLEQYSWYSDFL